MAELRLRVMEDEIPSSLSCGVQSIDELMQTAYNKTLYKQGLAYNIMVDRQLVGNCMLKIVCLCDEAEEYYVTDKQYTALEISYLAIYTHMQRKGIGTRVLKELILRARDLSGILPIRFLVIDAFEERVKWYEAAGFGVYHKKEDSRYPGTVSMKMDFINKEVVEKYAESRM